MTKREIDRRIDKHIAIAEEHFASLTDEEIAHFAYQGYDPVNTGIWAARKELTEELQNSKLSPKVLEREIAKVEALTQFLL